MKLTLKVITVSIVIRLRHDPPHAQTLDQAKPLLMNLFFLDRL